MPHAQEKQSRDRQNGGQHAVLGRIRQGNEDSRASGQQRRAFPSPQGNQQIAHDSAGNGDQPRE